jgi:hypothetical protein
VRREPEKSVRHVIDVIVREHIETFLAVVREERGKALPYYVANELRRYLDCGILAKGFLRVVCAQCGDEMLVAYSCKCRGACPSCSARRMCGSAAHLVDADQRTARRAAPAVGAHGALRSASGARAAA